MIASVNWGMQMDIINFEEQSYRLVRGSSISRSHLLQVTHDKLKALLKI
jgi:hypothetical protein